MGTPLRNSGCNPNPVLEDNPGRPGVKAEGLGLANGQQCLSRTLALRRRMISPQKGSNSAHCCDRQPPMLTPSVGGSRHLGEHTGALRDSPPPGTPLSVTVGRVSNLSTEKMVEGVLLITT